MKKLIRLFVSLFTSLLAIFFTAYPLIIRRWHSLWGSHTEERTRSYPGDELVALPRMMYTRAVSIQTTPDKVFPLLLQVGYKGNFPLMETLLGPSIREAMHERLEAKKLVEGDEIRLVPFSPLVYTVHKIIPDQALILQLKKRSKDSTANLSRVFYMTKDDSGETRLIANTRLDYEPTALNFFFWRVLVEPLHFLIEWRILHEIKQRMEAPLPQMTESAAVS